VLAFLVFRDLAKLEILDLAFCVFCFFDFSFFIVHPDLPYGHAWLAQLTCFPTYRQVVWR
jgi:hypothetical protein